MRIITRLFEQMAVKEPFMNNPTIFREKGKCYELTAN